MGYLGVQVSVRSFVRLFVGPCTYVHPMSLIFIFYFFIFYSLFARLFKLMNTLGRFLAIFSMEATFVTSSLLLYKNLPPPDKNGLL